MTLSVRALAKLSLLLLPFATMSIAHAWDATSHRLVTYVAWQGLPLEARDKLHAILQQHPRFQEDFLDQMPAAVMLAAEEEKTRWLLGQAATWPDMARGFAGEELIRYNRPDWHWIDGAWIRGDGIQGNVYVGVEPHPAQHAPQAMPNLDERDATNIMLALDFNHQVLTDPLSTAAQRAVALCWILHLVGDIHQPLHSGALVSTTLFATGDRGGNGISTRTGSLHATWDEALRSQPFEETLQRMLVAAQQTDKYAVSLDSAIWLDESRKMMQEFVYPDDIKAAVLRSERRDVPLEEFVLSDEYIASMQASSEEQITLAGIRLGLVLQRAMGN